MQQLLFKVPSSQSSNRGGDRVVSLVVTSGGSNLLRSSGLLVASWVVGVGVATMDCWR